MLKLAKAYLISSLSIRTNFNSLIAWKIRILILTLYMDLLFKNNIQRKCLSSRIDVFNRSNLFSISQLYKRCSSIVIRSSNYSYSSYQAYSEASLIKIIDIFLYNSILHYSNLNAIKLFFNSFRIFVFGASIVILSRITAFYFIAAFNKVSNLVYSNQLTTLSKQYICYFLNIRRSGRCSTSIQR